MQGAKLLAPPLRFPKCKLLAQLGGRHSFGAPTTDGRSARGGRGRALQVRLPAVFSPFHRRVLTPRAFFSVFLKTLSYVQRFSRYKTKAAVKEVRRYPRPAACTLPVVPLSDSSPPPACSRRRSWRSSRSPRSATCARRRPRRPSRSSRRWPSDSTTRSSRACSMTLPPSGDSNEAPAAPSPTYPPSAHTTHLPTSFCRDAPS